LLKKLLPILAVYLLIFIIFTPQKYNFPSNDDWVYSYTITNYYETGSIKLNDWCAASAIFQIWWGILFSKIFGYSLGVLRLSVLILSLTGSIFMYLMLKQLNYKNKLIPLLFFIFNPLYFILSLSFMTDVPYLVLFILSVYFYLTGLNGKPGYLITGSIFAGFAYLIRQLGILIPFTVIVYLFIFDRQKISLKNVLNILLIPVVVAGGHYYWYLFIHGKTWVDKAGLVSGLSFNSIYSRVLSVLVYIGLFTLPAGFIVRNKKNTPLKYTGIVFVFVLTTIIFIHILFYGFLPYIDNTLHKTGLGTITISGLNLKPAGIMSFQHFWVIITILSVFNLLILFRNSLKNLFSKEELFVIFCTLVQMAVSIIRFKFFDRYLLVILPVSVILTAKYINYHKIYNKLIIALSLILVILFSFAGTKDYFSWNEAKWTLGNKLVAEFGYKANEFANGFDWDGYHTFQPNIEKLQKIKEAKAIGDWEWQSLNPYKALISYRNDYPAEKYIAETDYFNWLNLKHEKIYAWRL